MVKERCRTAKDIGLRLEASPVTQKILQGFRNRDNEDTPVAA